ncbi:fluoride efflux transporter FluC [Flexivirga meconopsidis]|uniref:fluoride efflux transporter FluC n=1 Tax=Flexivirga meconopsidis TaxID=2977121 RepID=UPI00223FF863|nr:CrcB family protein [Flexivirga meconopsidis]
MSTESARPPHLRATALALVLVGGFCGTAARDLLQKAFPHNATGVPWATFGINLAGAFALGVLLEGLARTGGDPGRRRRLRLLAGTGFCGAFTTYSSLATDTVQLWEVGHRTTAGIAYAAGTVLAGLVCTWLGLMVASRTARGGAR